MTSIATAISGRSAIHGSLRALRPELLLGGADDGDVHGFEPPKRLQRDVDPGAVVEASRRDARIGQLERRRHDDDRVADLDERARLLPVPGADVDIELLPLDLLVVLHLPGDDAVDGAVLRPDLDPLPVGDVRPPASEAVRGDQGVVRDVRDGEADHIEVCDECNQRAFGPAARDDVADGIGLHLRQIADRVADDVERELLVPRGAVSAEKCIEDIWQRRFAGSLWT